MTRRGALGLAVALTVFAVGCQRRDVEAARLSGGGDPGRGKQALVKYGCATCHTIPGVPGASGTVGPSLEKVAVRSYLGGKLPNKPENLAKWIRHPQQAVPGNAMPDSPLGDDDVHDILAYLYTLR
jgi:cytochrome c